MIRSLSILPLEEKNKIIPFFKLLITELLNYLMGNNIINNSFFDFKLKETVLFLMCLIECFCFQPLLFLHHYQRRELSNNFIPNESNLEIILTKPD